MKRMRCYLLACTLVAFAVGCGGEKEKEPEAPSVTSLLKFEWRYSQMYSNTGVLIMTNRTGSATPDIWIRYLNQNSGNKSSYWGGPIKANDTVEVGFLESHWTIEPDEVVTVGADGYSPVELYFYKNTKGKMIMVHGYAAKKKQQLAERLKVMLQ